MHWYDETELDFLSPEEKLKAKKFFEECIPKQTLERGIIVLVGTKGDLDSNSNFENIFYNSINTQDGRKNI